MNWFRSFAIAFSMYSALPMPRVEWDEKGMRHALCWFPLVGVPAALALWGWYRLCVFLDLGRFLTAVGLTLLPLAVTGGIHLDGFCDAADALASRQPREKKLEIMKDPRTGAFGVMAVCGCLLLACAAWDSFLRFGGERDLWAVSAGLVLSRALSGLGVAVLPPAKESGLVRTFAAAADKRLVAVIDGLLALLAAGGMLALAPVPGLLGLLGASLALLKYSLVCREMGGTTGDLAGYFLVLCELAVLLGVTLGLALLEVFP